MHHTKFEGRLRSADAWLVPIRMYRSFWAASGTTRMPCRIREITSDIVKDGLKVRPGKRNQ